MNFIQLDSDCPSTFVRSFSNYTLKQPRGVVSHIPLKLIFVADVTNHSIVIFDSNLHHVTHFTYPNMLTPWNVCFSADYETLFVICDHGILRLNGDNVLFKKPGVELRGCLVLGEKIVTAACYDNAILEFDINMRLNRRKELDVYERGEYTLIIDFTIYDDLFYVIFLNCDYLLQTFDYSGARIKYLDTIKQISTPLFITHYKRIIYITDRDSSRVVCLNAINNGVSYIHFDTSDREKCEEKEFCVIRSDRKFGIFYGIEFSAVKNCLILCEML